MNRDYTIQAECSMPARLLQRCLEQGARFDAIRLWDNRRMTLRCDAASARTLLDLCRRYRVPARVLRRGGGSGLVAFAKRRRTLPVGLMAFIILSAFFLTRVWQVDIAFSGEAASLGNAAALRSAVEANGIAPGVLKRSIDPSLLAQKLTASGSYGYVGVRLHGVRLFVEAVPELPAPVLYDVDAARDLVSDRDGIIVRAVVRSGQLCVKPGDVVRRGQLLIRGEEQATKEETRPIAALGEVVVRSWVIGQAVLPLSGTAQRPTGRVACDTELVTPWHTWPIKVAGRFAQQSEEIESVPIGGLFLPVERTRVIRRELETVPVETDESVLKARLSALALSDAAMRLDQISCEITDSWINFERTPGAMRAMAVYEIQTNAAVTRQGLQGG